ncbi:MAG: helix-turn-helix domain-containing protein [Oscillospiraceae bacterium]
MVPETKNTCEQVFGKRLKELRKEHGCTIEQFADMVGISKSTLGYYENDKRMPDIEILARIANVLNVSADYLIGRTNTTAQKGKMKTVCEFTGLSDSAAEFLAQLVKDKDYEKLSVINHLFQELCEDYEFYSGEDEASSVLGALFRCFEKFTGSENEWENYVDLGDEKRKEMLAAAYRQFMLNQVTEAVKSSLEGYKQDNLPWRE